MKNWDWVKLEAAKHRRLLELRAIIEIELTRQMPFSEMSIRITLRIIRREFGRDAEIETLRQFGLPDQNAA